MHPTDDWRIALGDALTAEDGANGEMRRAMRYNLAIADEIARAGYEEDRARHRERVEAHRLRARNFAALTLPVVVELWTLLPWLERARIAVMLLLPATTRRAGTNPGKR